MVMFSLWQLFLQKICFLSFSSFAQSVSYSLQFKRKYTGVFFTLQVKHSGEVSMSICSCDHSALSVLFSVLQFYKFLFWKYFLEEWPLVLTSYEICQGQCLYILCVLSFPIFQSIYLWRAFCYLVIFQIVIVGCWAVDVLLFVRLFL